MIVLTICILDAMVRHSAGGGKKKIFSQKGKSLPGKWLLER